MTSSRPGSAGSTACCATMRAARSSSRTKPMVTSHATVAGLSGSKPSPVVRGNSSRWRPKPGGRGGIRSRICLGMVSSRRLQGGGEGVERLALIGGGFPFDGRAAIAAHAVDVIDAGHHGGGRFHRIAVIHVDGHQRLLDGGHGSAGADGVLAQAVERGAANLHDAIQLVGLIDAVRPLVDFGIRVEYPDWSCSADPWPRRRRGFWRARAFSSPLGSWR